MLFVGNLHPAVQRERLPWLARLAKLADRRNVVISNGDLGRRVSFFAHAHLTCVGDDAPSPGRRSPVAEKQTGVVNQRPKNDP